MRYGATILAMICVIPNTMWYVMLIMICLLPSIMVKVLLLLKRRVNFWKNSLGVGIRGQLRLQLRVNILEALYADPALKTLKSTAGATYLDQYMLRLAETYLLRAEAF